MTYPRESIYSDWKAHAEDMGMSVSEFIQAMVEAGRKKFDRGVVEPDETLQDIRQERNRLLEELEHAEETIDLLKQETHTVERQAILDYLEENDRASFEELVEHIGKTVPERASQHIDLLIQEGDIQEENGKYAR